MFKKIILSSIIIFLSGCTDRLENDIKLGYVKPTVTFESPIVSDTTQFIFATKRGIDDYNCDGIEDIAAMSDKTRLWEEQDFKADFYEGYYKDNLLNFKPSKLQLNIPFRVEKWVTQFKMDSVKLNNDDCADIVYTGFSDTNNGKFQLKFAINDITKKMDDENRLIPLETHFDNKEYYKTGIGRTENVFIDFIHTMQSDYYYDDEDSTIYSYLKQDWCDFNGDGADDFILMWDAENSLSVLIAYSSPYGETGYSQFVDTESFFIQDFLVNRSVSSIDTADYNGDGACDILSYKRSRNNLKVSVATFTDGTFVPEQTINLKMPPDLDFFSSASKFDTFDRNRDGKSDLNYITEKNDKQVIVTWLTK